MSYVGTPFELESVLPRVRADVILGADVPIGYMDFVGTSITDNIGVPLNSDRGASEASQTIDFEYKPCPYKSSPSRYPDGQPHETPMSGLEQRRLLEQFSDVLALAQAVRLKLFPDKHDLPLNNMESIHVLNALKWLPRYLVFKADTPYKNGDLPPALLVSSNCASGTLASIFSAAEDRLSEGVNYAFSQPDPQAMIQSGESRGTMIGEKTVCAAPLPVMEAYIAMVANLPGNATAEVPPHLQDVLREIDFGKFMVLIDVVQEADKIAMGVKPFKDYVAYVRSEIQKEMAAINSSHKKQRIKNLRLAKTKSDLDKLEASYEEEIQKSENVLGYFEKQINGLLGRKVPNRLVYGITR